MKNYIFVGGSYGIGKSAIEKLIDNDHQVHLYSRTQGDFSEFKDKVHHHVFDASKDEFRIDGLPPSCEGLVYLPGTINLKPFTRLKPEDFIQDFQLNFVNMTKILSKVLPLLKKSNLPSSVVLFSSVVVQNGMPFHSLVGSSKGAIEGFTKNMASEFAPKVRFNCLAPSLTETPLAKNIVSNPKVLQNSIQKHPLQRIGRPSDLGKMLCFLLKEDSFMTGQIIHIDGGMSL